MIEIILTRQEAHNGVFLRAHSLLQKISVSCVRQPNRMRYRNPPPTTTAQCQLRSRRYLEDFSLCAISRYCILGVKLRVRPFV
ncbi:hypothetical protein J6590_091203 [Homalodisca vitripennis]|nr:hypothetical protein J6590_091203 [Homalodisca vitripennis]